MEDVKVAALAAHMVGAATHSDCCQFVRIWIHASTLGRSLRYTAPIASCMRAMPQKAKFPALPNVTDMQAAFNARDGFSGQMQK